MTNPPVSMPCLHAISSLLERDKKLRIGAAGFETFSDNPFFRPIDFGALERKEVEPIFKPSSDKTNFDATYDLEELLLEEAPLEARARRQKPREQLKEDATEQEIRAEELHKMIETLFEPFNYQLVSNERPGVILDQPEEKTATPSEWPRPTSEPKHNPDDNLRVNTTVRPRSRSSTNSPNGSPPLHTASPPPLPRSDKRDQSPDCLEGNMSDTPGEIPRSHGRQGQRARGSTRSTSMGGGVQVVLNETGSWSEMANQSSAMVVGDDKSIQKPTGMLGFLTRKKGRDRSPKAKERGVIGKEGARVIISNT